MNNPTTAVEAARLGPSGKRQAQQMATALYQARRAIVAIEPPWLDDRIYRAIQVLAEQYAAAQAWLNEVQ